MMPILYEKNEKVFNTLGLGALSDIIKPIVREEKNGLFEMEFKYPINSPLFMDLTYGRIVVADASPKLKNQRFVIVRIEADDEGIAHFYCEHIAQFKAKNTTLKPIVNAIDVNAWQALDNWNKNLLGDVTFNVTSDITTTSTIKWNISKVKNARLALGGVEGSILDKYHGEYRFDNMNINLMKSRGQNLGAYIAYGKNLTSLSQDLEIENTYTSIQPFVVYFDNIEKVDSSGKVAFERIEKTLVLTEHVLHSEYVNNYPQALVAAVEFDAKDIMAPEVEYTYKDANGKEVRKSDAQVQEERLKRLQDSENTLRIKAKEYIKINKIGIPKVKINLTFVDLASSLEYKGIAKTEEINLCDYVTIDFLNLGINRVTSQVVKVEYNPKLERYERLTIGEIGSKFQSSVVANKKAIEEVKNQLGTVKEDLNIVRVSADGMTLTFYGPDEPIANNINDKWYKDLGGGDTELRIWDGTIWKFIMSTRDISEAKNAAEDALLKVGEAKSAADEASNSLQNILPIIDENTKIRQDLNGETGNTSLTTIRQSLDSFASQFAKIPSNIASTVKVDEYGIPIPPYNINDIWIKDAYDFTQRYDIFDEDETKNLQEFLSEGVWISKVNKLEGEEFDWDDWKKVSVDAGYQLSTIEQDINQIMLATKKGDLISAINIQAGRVLMSSGDSDGKSRLMLSKDGTYIDNALIESAHIKDAAITTAKIGNAQIDTAKIADAAVTSAKILNLDVYKVSGLTSEFVRSKWNAINSNLTVDGNQLVFSHTDGTMTVLDATGLYTRVGTSKYMHSYLTYANHYLKLNAPVTAPIWVTLPPIWKGRKFDVMVSLASTAGMNDLGNESVIRNVSVGHLGGTKDYINGRFQLYGICEYYNTATKAKGTTWVDVRYLVQQIF